MAVKSSTIPVQKNGVYTVHITGLGSSGEGVGKYEGFTIFVPHALPEEEVKVKIILAKKSYAIGKMLEVLKTSEARVTPRCPIYYPCGGCQLQHINYQKQLDVKRQMVVDAVERLGKIKDITIHPTMASPEEWYYRNKMQFPVGENDKNLVLGCYAQGSHRVIETEHCYIQHELNNHIVKEVKKICNAIGISAYNEHTGEGMLRHVIGRVGTASGELMIVLVTATKGLPYKDKIIKELTQKIPNLVSIMHNINTQKTNVILGETTIKLWGQDYITDSIGPFKFNISPKSFFQVNTLQAEQLYKKAVQYASLSGNETVIDAYCGTGTISLFLAEHAKKVYGIEVVEAAIDDAWGNARLNDVDNVEFVVGDATDIMPKMYEQGIRAEVVVVDPPRAGCTRTVLETFASMKPKRIVYVSCNPASLARDLAVLVECGYIAREIQPFDMFPQTHHVECVALLQRKHREKP